MTPVIASITTTGGNDSGETPRSTRIAGDGVELHLAELLRVARDLVADRLAVVRERDELDVEGRAA